MSIQSVAVTKKASMDERFIEDYLNKITLLEKQIGANVGYKQLEPFWVPGTHFGDPYKIQGAAKKIAEFAGLGNLTFLVTIKKQKERVAGHIELKYSGNDVFIEVSDDIVNFEDAAVATLSHEITHKYMHLNGISSGTGIVHEYENEVFTDITTVFLGLGKFMLNGSEVEKTHSEIKADGTHSITESRKCGYLNRKQLAFVYRIVCAMREVSREDMISNLSTEAIGAIWYWDKYYEDYFDPQLQSERFRDKLITEVMEDIKEAQNQINEANTLLHFIKQNYIQSKEELLSQKYERIRYLQDEWKFLQQEDIYDPCLKFLDAIRLRKLASEIRTNIGQNILDLLQMKQELSCLKKKIQKGKSLKPQRKSIVKRIFLKLYH